MRWKLMMQVGLCSALLVCSGWAAAGKGSSSSMSRGFSSSRSASISKPTVSPRPSSFGSFGKSTSSSNATRPDSVMYRDMSQRQAQSNAMKTWDARQAAKRSSATPTPSSNVPGAGATSVTGRPLPAYGQSASPATANTSNPNATNTMSTGPTQSSDRSAMMKGVLAGAVVGAVMSQPHTVYANGSNSGATSSSVPAGPEPVTAQGEFKQSQIVLDGSEPAANTVAPAEVQQKTETTAPAAAKAESQGTNSTSFGTWMFLLSISALFVWWVKRRLRTLRQTEQNLKPHYSL